MKRPWLAAGLALLVTGLGHAYLRRWIRALGWVGLVVVTAVVFVPDATLADPGGSSLGELAPIVLVGLLSAVDAYLVAKRQNARRQVETAERCSSCGRELEAELSFCQWCASDAETVPDSN